MSDWLGLLTKARIGPSLAGVGLTGVLADPFFTLYNGSGQVILSNDNWKDTQQSQIQATGLAPSNNLESAIIATISPGNYSVILQGKGGGTGIGLVDVYALQGTAEISNFSVRANVGTGNNVLIGGVIVQSTGGGPQVLVRGLGPSIPGVTGKLQNPMLQLFDANGVMLASNNNWQDTQAADIQATGKAPANSFESAILINLVPGNYTAIESGANNTTGIGLLEFYKLH